jgi:hypothetical protein
VSQSFRLTLVQKPDVKSDLFDWGTFVYTLKTNQLPQGNANYHETEALVHQQNFPNLASDLMGDIVRRCWMQHYGSVAELRRDVESFLVSKGYEVEGDSLRDFDPANIP